MCTQAVFVFVLHYRHRASNMFLEGYKRNWLHTEGYSFEDRMIDDLSVSFLSYLVVIWECFLFSFMWVSLLLLSVYYRKQWSKKKEKKKKRKKLNRIPSTSWFCISVALLWQKRGWIGSLECCCARKHVWTETGYPSLTNCLLLSYFSKLDTDHLYMAYADIMAKVSLFRRVWAVTLDWSCAQYQMVLIVSFLVPCIVLELPYWWGRRRGRGNVGKCWGWDVLWGATVRTGNGRPGARDEEHTGAVALNALSGVIIRTLFHSHNSLCLC